MYRGEMVSWILLLFVLILWRSARSACHISPLCFKALHPSRWLMWLSSIPTVTSWMIMLAFPPNKCAEPHQWEAARSTSTVMVGSSSLPWSASSLRSTPPSSILANTSALTVLNSRKWSKSRTKRCLAMQAKPLSFGARGSYATTNVKNSARGSAKASANVNVNPSFAALSKLLWFEYCFVHLIMLCVCGFPAW